MPGARVWIVGGVNFPIPRGFQDDAGPCISKGGVGRAVAGRCHLARESREDRAIGLSSDGIVHPTGGECDSCDAQQGSERKRT
jgi:hypothetical protein